LWTHLIKLGISITSAGSGPPSGPLSRLEGDAAVETENVVTTGPFVQKGSCCCSYDGELGRITRFEEGRRLIPKKEPNRPDGDFAEDMRGRRR
jgi:hypothetical protein